MKTKKPIFTGILVITAVSVIGWLIVMVPGQWSVQIQPAEPPIGEGTSMVDFEINDGNFDAVHSRLEGDPNGYLIFGNLPIAPPADDLHPELAVFLGRWEGYSYGPPVAKDWKYVLVIQEINALGGKAFVWGGTNLQYPAWIKEIRFRVKPGTPPSIEICEISEGRVVNYFTVTYNQENDTLQGWMKNPDDGSTWGPIELNREKSFTVYKDYSRYLESKRIYAKTYRDEVLTTFYGSGFLVYLPEGYEDDPEKNWPLIIFLHGSGDRGDNLYLLAKASPLMMIREKGPLPFIIVAPLLKNSPDFYSFPENYMDGVLQQALEDYRVDRHRIYVTGLSMGGEATYRFALHRPDLFAAIAPLSAYLRTTDSMDSLKGLPVWVIHGANDTVIPVAVAQVPVDTLKQAGADVRFTVLENHDHDVWTDTYTDPAFYAWLLEHMRP